MTEKEAKSQVRKLQKSPTGFYVNLPKKIIKNLNIDGTELVKVSPTGEANKLVIEIVKI